MESLKKITLSVFAIALLALAACQSGRQPSNADNEQSDNEQADSSKRRGDLVVYLDSINRLTIKSDSLAYLKTEGGPEVQIMDPAISPDGQQIAYTEIRERSDLRTVSLMDLSTRKTTQLQVPSGNFYGPVWSPDGLLIAVSIFNKNNTWKIGVIGSNNKGYKMLDSLSSVDYYSPTWKGNDQLVAHNTEKLYTLNLKGQVIDSASFDELIGKDYILSSSDSFYFSRDGKKLFFNVGNQDSLPAELMGPSEALYELNIADKQIKRLSPPGMTVNRIFVTADDRIFYEGSAPPYEVVQLFEAGTKGEAKLLAKEGSAISVASHAGRP